MKIYELLDSPEKWTKKYYARDKAGYSTNSCDNYACCWCLVGAAMKCYGNMGSDVIVSVLNIKAMLLGYKDAIEFNDN